MESRASYGVGMTTNPKGGVMKVKGSRRLVARLGLALAVAAIAAPSAQAVTMNAMFETGGSGAVRLYADDLHAPMPVATLKASNVQSDAASPQSFDPAANVLTDAADPGPVSRPVSVPISFSPSEVQADSASTRPVSLPGVKMFAEPASTVDVIPLTDARHSALLKHEAQIQQPTQPATTPLVSADSTGIDWSVAAIGAVLGALGLMLLVAVVFFTGRHHKGRLAAT
jgi:hypothetical protein